MPYRVNRTIWLKDPEKESKQIARNPGDILSQEDLADIPERVRDRHLSSLVDSGKLTWVDSPQDRLATAKEIVAAADEEYKQKKEIDEVLAKHVNAETTNTAEPKRRGRPPKK